MSRPTAILYSSLTGFTARYAGMLARATGIPAYDLSARKELPVPNASVLYLGWLCAGKVKHLASVKKKYQVQAVCAVGMAHYASDGILKLISDNRLGTLPFFYLRGGYAYEKLPAPYNLMMTLMARMLGKAPAETDEQQAMQEAFAHGSDWVSSEQLTPVLDWLERTP